MAKLALSVDDHVVFRAKKYAKSKGISVSQMVETYLAVVVPDLLERRGDRGLTMHFEDGRLGLEIERQRRCGKQQ